MINKAGWSKSITVFVIFAISFSAVSIATTALTASGTKASPAASMITNTRHVLVTGGNKGIGYAICRKLLENYPDVHVILGARDASLGTKAVESLKEVAPSRVELSVMDVADDTSVATAAEALCAGRTPGWLYGIINNAGIGFGRGFHDTLETNYFGPRRVVDALAVAGDALMPRGRIVNIASAAGPNFLSRCEDPTLRGMLSNPRSIEADNDNDAIAKLDAVAQDYQMKTDHENSAYGLSKALLNAYTVRLAVSHPEWIVNSCSPGYILTDMTRELGGATNPPEKGTACPIHLLLSDEMLELPTGSYYGSDIVRSPLDRYRGPGDPPYEGP